jgi:hypothetical protein
MISHRYASVTAAARASASIEAGAIDDGNGSDLGANGRSLVPARVLTALGVIGVIVVAILRSSGSALSAGMGTAIAGVVALLLTGSVLRLRAASASSDARRPLLAAGVEAAVDFRVWLAHARWIAALVAARASADALPARAPWTTLSDAERVELAHMAADGEHGSPRAKAIELTCAMERDSYGRFRDAAPFTVDWSPLVGSFVQSLVLAAGCAAVGSVVAVALEASAVGLAMAIGTASMLAMLWSVAWVGATRRRLRYDRWARSYVLRSRAAEQVNGLHQDVVAMLRVLEGAEVENLGLDEPVRAELRPSVNGA